VGLSGLLLPEYMSAKMESCAARREGCVCVCGGGGVSHGTWFMSVRHQAIATLAELLQH
jgi:hypothetical protein